MALYLLRATREEDRNSNAVNGVLVNGTSEADA